MSRHLGCSHPGSEPVKPHLHAGGPSAGWALAVLQVAAEATYCTGSRSPLPPSVMPSHDTGITVATEQKWPACRDLPKLERRSRRGRLSDKSSALLRPFLSELSAGVCVVSDCFSSVQTRSVSSRAKHCAAAESTRMTSFGVGTAAQHSCGCYTRNASTAVIPLSIGALRAVAVERSACLLLATLHNPRSVCFLS